MANKTHHEIELLSAGVTKYMPRELAFCNEAEFLAMSGLLMRWQLGEIQYEDLRVQAVYAFLDFKFGKRRINDLEQMAMHSNIYEISRCVDTFFNKTPENDLQIKLNLINNPILNIKPFIKEWMGPEARFVNTTFGQYIDALNIFHLYHRTSDVKYLYLLMATYYLPKNRPYNPDKTEKRASLIKALISKEHVHGFFLYFSSFHNDITTSRMSWEGNLIDFSILFSGSNDDFKSEIPGLGMKSIAYTLAESNIIGNLNDVRKEKLWEVLLLLYDLRKKDMDNLARQKEAENKSNSTNS